MDSKKLLFTLCLMFVAFICEAQQSFRPIIIDLSSSQSYTVPNDSILKIESIGIVRLPAYNAGVPWNSSSPPPNIRINGKLVAIFVSVSDNSFGTQILTDVLKFPFWVPNGTLLQFDGSIPHELQVYGLLMPK